MSHAVGSWIYTADREQAVRAVGGFATAQRIANLSRLVQDTPREARQRIVAALSDQSFRVSLSAQAPAIPAVEDDDASAAEAIREFLVERAIARHRTAAAGVGIRIDGRAAIRSPAHDGAWPHDAWLRFRGASAGCRSASLSRMASGCRLPRSCRQAALRIRRRFLLSMGVMALIILAVSVWAVRRVTAPLGSLATAAERLGNDVNAPPLPETGTIETQAAARAFNEMQTRLRNLIENRTRLLAAISHDLRTPLTLLRLRTETVENKEERDKMLATIAEMDSHDRHHAAVCP